MKKYLYILLLVAASVGSLPDSELFASIHDHTDRCIPLKRPSSVETARCVEDSVPVARLTDLILHQLHWHSFIFISDNTTVFDAIAEVFMASGVSVSTIDVRTAVPQAWIRSAISSGLSSKRQNINVLLACSVACVRKLLKQVEDFDAKSKGQSAIWMTWSWLIGPPCENGSFDPDTFRLTTTINNVALLTPVMEIKSKENGRTHTVCPSLLSLRWDQTGDRQWMVSGHLATCPSLLYHAHNDVFPNKMYGFNGRKLTFAVKEWSIFMYSDEENGQKTWRGSYFDLLEYLSILLNFTYTLTEPPDGKFGSLVEQGQWDGVLGMVQRGEALAVWIPYDITQERAVHFDFPSPTDYSSTSFIYLPPDTDDKLLLLLQPLSWQVLTCVAASVPLVTFLLWLLESVHPARQRDHVCMSNRTSDSAMLRSLRLVIGALFAEASPDDWRWGGSRLMVGSWWLVTVVLAAAYSGSLVAHLSLTPPYLPFRSLEDVVKQTQYKWGILANASFHNLVKKNNISLYQRVSEGLDRFSLSDPSVLSADSEIHFGKVINEKYVYIGPLYQLSLWQRRDCRLVTGQNELKQSMAAPVFAKDSALTSYFSDVIDELRANGLIEAWNTRWMDNSDCAPSQEHSTVISLGHLQGVFYAAVSGLGLSLLLLLTERGVSTRNKRT